MRIGGIDDGVGRFGCNIALYELDSLAGWENGFLQEAVHKNILPLINRLNCP
jgi:hypothetical protein